MTGANGHAVHVAIAPGVWSLVTDDIEARPVDDVTAEIVIWHGGTVRAANGTPVLFRSHPPSGGYRWDHYSRAELDAEHAEWQEALDTVIPDTYEGDEPFPDVVTRWYADLRSGDPGRVARALGGAGCAVEG